MNAEDAKVPQRLCQFDVILRFETLDHLSQENAFMQNIHQMLKQGGTLIISTPIGAGGGQPAKEPYSIHQLRVSEFTALFDQYDEKEFYYQSFVRE
ncbi:class I SAM-dependent methyltransferase [Bacillus sp. SCS-153A]|uniref:class I SAM-dependent methyltransferase n=1 Tax=Rossellomorea sedimentorum TaxID=3115294 RepID=UPI0039060FAF